MFASCNPTFTWDELNPVWSQRPLGCRGWPPNLWSMTWAGLLCRLSLKLSVPRHTCVGNKHGNLWRMGLHMKQPSTETTGPYKLIMSILICSSFLGSFPNHDYLSFFNWWCQFELDWTWDVKDEKNKERKPENPHTFYHWSMTLPKSHSM